MLTKETKIKKLFNQDMKKAGRHVHALSDRFHSGYPDYFECYDGRFIAYEAKAYDGKMTPKQKQFARLILHCGGEYYLVRGTPMNKNYQLIPLSLEHEYLQRPSSGL